MNHPIESILGGQRNEIVPNLDWRDYRDAPGLNPSTIVHGLKSLKHLKHGWDQGYGDSDDLARAVIPLLSDPARRETMSAAATKYVMERRRWSVIVPAYLPIYQQVCG